ncbi:primosomal protein N' [Acinetobacter larvae]|uniref:Replication restart protein PriA n=1 Tax=Acinetobacter larvae TaxID=1789224 RepID=A0A1B2M451_9GAMM|nr:primosomal protein N' [Acinetobacter larvae]AOA59823.1 primosomal protein N' [Acinetobacter larvae]
MTLDASQTTSLPYRIRVAVPVPLYDSFDYALTAEQYAIAQIGARVAVPFGRQKLVGIIVEKLAPDSALNPNFQIKFIHALLDQQPILEPIVLSLLTWAAQYYQFPIGEVMHSALPSLLRQGKPYDLLARVWRLLDLDAEAQLKRSEKQQQAYKILKLHPQGTAETILNLSGIDNNVLKALAKKGIARCDLETQDFRPEPVQLAQMPLTANADQKHAIQQILKALQRYQGFLLDGLTGSGKTEVYLQVMHQVLKQGKQVLVLVPEIGLTPQTISRFQSRFHGHIALLHSGLTENKRLQAWQAAQTGKASIILGTRSAILAPMANLGLIILDEEHDLSYKQQEGFRYHARDVALYRAALLRCPIILGSATPSIESYHLVAQAKLSCLQLNQRAGIASMPKMHVIDLTVARKQHGLSEQLLTEMRKRLAENEQVLLFLNRRGYAPVLLCENCAWQAQCPHCDANLTLHVQPYQHLHCHHCGTIQSMPQHCPKCQHQPLKPIGLGTAKIENVLQTLFSDVPIIRVDRDSTSKVGSWHKIHEQIHKSEASILLGTQMLAKGHHFPYVTLVAILDIDAGLLSVDFRAPERTAQLIIQVAGRSGRGEKKGEVYLQTYRPDHPLFQTLLKHDYRCFAQETLAQRQLAQLPPFRYAILLRAESRHQDYNQQFLSQMRDLLLQQAEENLITVWGPIPAAMERKAGRFQAHMVLLSHDRPRLHFYVRQWWPQLLKAKTADLRISIDVDPQELS